MQPGCDPESLTDAHFHSFVVVPWVEGCKIGLHVARHTPEPTDVLEGFRDLFLFDFADILFDEIITAFHFPGKEVPGVAVEPPTLGIPYLFGDIKPGISEEPAVFAGGGDIKEKMDMRGFSFLEFENPNIMKIATVFSFDPAYEPFNHGL